MALEHNNFLEDLLLSKSVGYFIWWNWFLVPGFGWSVTF